MNRDYIPVKMLEGELKLSQVKRGFRCSITTKEIIFQKPHHSYQIQLADIISMVPYNLESKPISFSLSTTQDEQVIATFGKDYYKISAEKIKVFNRQGVHEKGQTEIIVALNSRFLEQVALYSNMTIVK
jgi:hypothetical protein